MSFLTGCILLVRVVAIFCSWLRMQGCAPGTHVALTEKQAGISCQFCGVVLGIAPQYLVSNLVHGLTNSYVNHPIAFNMVFFSLLHQSECLLL